MAPRLSGQKLQIFESFYCTSIPKRDLTTKRRLSEGLGDKQNIDISNVAYWSKEK